MLAGASIRYRLYSAWGLSTLEITKVIIFCFGKHLAGFLRRCRVDFSVRTDGREQPGPPAVQFIEPPLGVLLLGLVAAYFLIGARAKKNAACGQLGVRIP